MPIVKRAAKTPANDTRQRILAAARVNKAMIYYHFPDKRALYRCIIRDAFGPISASLGAVAADRTLSPAQKLDRLIEALVASIDRSGYVLPVFLREVADGGTHLGADELDLLAGAFGAVSGVIAEGVKQNTFQPVHPALAHFTLVAPLLIFRAAAPIRARIRSVRRVEIPEADPETVVRHLQMVARRMLARSGEP